MQPIPFGKYVLVERLAQGGMAEVFRAVYSGAAGFEKQVAVKRILPVFDGAREFVAMFGDEARIASSLTHVNIVQVFDFGERDGSYYLAMELVDGVDLGRLREAAARRGLRVPVPIVAFIIAEAARGLAYAHEKRGSDGAPLGIVHRDVSPQNVLVSYAGEVKLADFGIAKATGKLHKTESGAVMGKIRYMSPEQITGEPLDGRSDVFALGVILWEMLAGAPLWSGDNPGAVAEQVKNARVEPPSRRAREVPGELDRIVLKALERSRDARYGRAAELARELSAWLASAAPSLHREDVGAFVQEVVPRSDGEPANISAHAPTEVSPAERLSGVSPQPSAPPPATTRRETPTARKRARGPWIAVAALVVFGGGAMALRPLWSEPETLPPPPPSARDGGATPVLDAGARVSDGDKLRLLVELEKLPRAASTWRGVQFEDYLAVLSAVDGAICLTPAGAREPMLPSLARTRVEAQQLTAETNAVARYLLTVGELPPRVAGSLQVFLRNHAAFAPGAAGWSMARLGALVRPDDARVRLDVIRQNGALAGWRDAAGPWPALCERQAAVDAYAARAPTEPRVQALRRYLHATPLDQALDDGGLRYTVTGAERDEAAATLLVRLRVTNPGGDDRPLAVGDLRLGGVDTSPTVDPPASRLGAGQVRDLRLTFAGVPDAVAEAALLVVRPGVELQAYSEDLR